MPFTLRYHPAVRVEDLPLIDRRTKDRIRKAIEERLKEMKERINDENIKLKYDRSINFIQKHKRVLASEMIFNKTIKPIALEEK